MTKPNGDMKRFGAGVMLGGRQYTLTLSRDLDMNLQAFAQMNRATPNAYAQFLLERAIVQATREFAVGMGIGLLRVIP